METGQDDNKLIRYAFSEPYRSPASEDQTVEVKITMNNFRRLKATMRRKLYGVERFLAYQWNIPILASAWDRKEFWEGQAEAIHARWGRGEWDFHVLSSIIEKYDVQSVLDIGCGSGRLFSLYRKHGLRKILGVDISNEALEIARQEFPEVPTICMSIERQLLPSGTWDLGISNRVLQHIPQRYMDALIQKICEVCKLVYINELAESDGLSEEFFMRRYDYEQLFLTQGYYVLEKGMLDKQTYLLFERDCRRD